MGRSFPQICPGRLIRLRLRFDHPASELRRSDTLGHRQRRKCLAPTPSLEIDGLPSSAVSLVADGESMGCGLAGGCTDAPAPNPSVKSLDVKRG